MAITTSSSLNVCVTIGIRDFSIDGKDCHASDDFCAPAPFDAISWRLLVHPRGRDESVKGYVSVQLEINTDNLPNVKKNLISPTLIQYKIGIVNSAFKVVDHVLQEDDFGRNRCGKPIHFLRLPIVSGKEADQVIKEDTLFFRCEITYPETLLKQMFTSSEHSLTDGH